MSDEKDDDKGRANFGDLEKKIVTDSINPGGKPDYLTQRNEKKRRRGLDDPSVLRGGDSVPAVVPPSVMLGTVLGVVYLVVLAGFVWTGYNAVGGIMGANGSGTQGRAVVDQPCSGPSWSDPGSWIYPVTTCSGFFVPTSPDQLQKGVVVTDGVTIVGAGDAKKGQEITGATLPSFGSTAYAAGYSGWIWWTVAAVVLLALFLFLTFRRHGVVPGARAVLHARAEKRARVHAQELARERARELRKKRAAEAREKSAAKSGKSSSSAKSSSGKSETAKKSSGSTGSSAAKKAEPKKTAQPRKKAKNPAHAGTVAGTGRKVEPEDAEEGADKAE